MLKLYDYYANEIVGEEKEEEEDLCDLGHGDTSSDYDSPNDPLVATGQVDRNSIVYGN